MTAEPVGVEEAPAKINLALHVRARRPDGYHDLETLFAFTRFGDRLEAEEARDWSLEVVGPTAGAAGPLAGIIGQLLVGVISDRVWFWGGRRRPFRAGGGCAGGEAGNGHGGAGRRRERQARVSPTPG